MKMQGNIFDSVTSMDNIEIAFSKAKKGKSSYREVKWVEANKEKALSKVRSDLIEGKFTTSKYKIEHVVCGGKERVLHKLPFFPDRIVHHSIVNICSDAWVKSMIRDTFQSIPGRGTLDCFKRVRKGVQGDKIKYALKLDIVKFYPSIQNQYLLDPKVLRIKDVRVMALLEDIICSLPLVPLGNHTSQYLGNLVLNSLDWFSKQDLKLKYYFRYCDDIVLLSNCKRELYSARDAIEEKLNDLSLNLKPNSQIVNLTAGYLDFVGYRVNHKRALLRKSIAERYKESCKANNLLSLASYYGWCKHVNALNLYNVHAKGMNHENIV